MATITLENIPDDLFARLKLQARMHRRSVDGELIHCLEAILRPRKVPTEERIERIRNLRPRIDPNAIREEDILKAIAEGRP